MIKHVRVARARKAAWSFAAMHSRIGVKTIPVLALKRGEWHLKMHFGSRQLPKRECRRRSDWLEAGWADHRGIIVSARLRGQRERVDSQVTPSIGEIGNRERNIVGSHWSGQCAASYHVGVCTNE